MIVRPPISFEDWKARIMRLDTLASSLNDGGNLDKIRTIHRYMFQEGPLWEYGAARGLRWGAEARTGELMIAVGVGEAGRLYPFASFRGSMLLPLSESTQSMTEINDVSGNAGAMTSDQALKFYEQELRREPSNFRDRHANKATTAARVHKKLRDAHRAIQRMTEPPSRVVADKFIGYITGTIQPILEEHGFEFPALQDIVVDLQTKMGEEVGT